MAQRNFTSSNILDIALSSINSRIQDIDERTIDYASSYGLGILSSLLFLRTVMKFFEFYNTDDDYIYVPVHESPPHIPTDDDKFKHKIYYEAEVLPPVKNSAPKRRLRIVEDGQVFSQKRITYNAPGKRRRSYKRYRPRKNNGYRSRHRGIRGTPTRRLYNPKPDWNGYAKLDVPSFGFYNP